MTRSIIATIESDVVVVEYKRKLLDISQTDIWMDYKSSVAEGQIKVKLALTRAEIREMVRESTVYLTEAPSIYNIKAEGIIGAVTGCRINGGGSNMCIVNTMCNTYIVGARMLLTRQACGNWKCEELTMEADIKFCKELDNSYDSYNGELMVIGCEMPQIYNVKIV